MNGVFHWIACLRAGLSSLIVCIFLSQCFSQKLTAEIRLSEWGQSESNIELGGSNREVIPIVEKDIVYSSDITQWEEYSRANTKVSDAGIEHDFEFAWGPSITGNQFASSLVIIDFEVTEPMYYKGSGEVEFEDPYGSATFFEAKLLGNYEGFPFSWVQNSRNLIYPNKYLLGGSRGNDENHVSGRLEGIIEAGSYRLWLRIASSEHSNGDTSNVVGQQMDADFKGPLTGLGNFKIELNPIPRDAKLVIDIDPVYYSLANQEVVVNANPLEGYPDLEFEYEWYFNGEPIERDFTKNPALLVIDGTEASIGQYKVIVSSSFDPFNEDTRVEKTFEYRHSPDTDGDGLSDDFEQRFFGSDFEVADTDGDGLSDYQEYEVETDPSLADSDGDGLSDGDEITIMNTNPMRADTDKNSIDDGAEDFDGDGLDNFSELEIHRTDPFFSDTDRDTITDYHEVQNLTDPNEFTVTEDVLHEIEMVNIFDEGNAPDSTGFGQVDYSYRISKYEVSRRMIDSYNYYNERDLPKRLWNDNQQKFSSLNQPARAVTWADAARFINWLNAMKGYAPAYKFGDPEDNTTVSLWLTSEQGYNPQNPLRNGLAYYFLPSEDEWYKAAYHDPSANDGAGGYWAYATGVNTTPIQIDEGVEIGTAVWGKSLSVGPSDVRRAGGLSPYGTMAQTGNVLEFCETAFDGVNNLAGEEKVLRGGEFNTLTTTYLTSSSRHSRDPFTQDSAFRSGFRIASISNDRDNDGLIDSVETNTGVFADETNTGTDPDNPDTDGDGLLDSVETNTGVFVNASDTGTSPLIFDSNKNGSSDGQDFENNRDPVRPLNLAVDLDDFYENKPESELIVDVTPLLGFPSNVKYHWYLNDVPVEEQAGGVEGKRVFRGNNDEEGEWTVVVSHVGGEIRKSFDYRVFNDSDFDGLSDYRETFILLTLPNDPDSDGDGLLDGEEFLTHRTNPLARDSDGDGFTDRYEIETAYDPNSAESFPVSKVNIMTAIEVNFITKIGVTYTIEFSTDSQNWTVIEDNIVGEGLAIERLYSRKEYPTGFFRVKSDEE